MENTLETGENASADENIISDLEESPQKVLYDTRLDD